MFSKKSLLVLSSVILLAGCSTQKETKSACNTKDTCLRDAKCLCWCSQGCNYREKQKDDHPLYIENDPNGKFCYCKQWDLDNYEGRCIEGKEIPQPEGAK